MNESGRQRIADAFFGNFNDPRDLTPAFTDIHEARKFIAKVTGHSWLWSAVRGRVAVARDQVRQRLRSRATIESPDQLGARAY